MWVSLPFLCKEILFKLKMYQPECVVEIIVVQCIVITHIKLWSILNYREKYWSHLHFPSCSFKTSITQKLW